ncbi:MAG: alpha/beta hydrolase fold domain-containing protein, partial [Vallitaleaceae bacterium]|nr:alpha/beta hydrolase fold domain-containing protein [Vallitaleaceae bacterium]
MLTCKERSFVSRLAEVYIKLTGDQQVFRSTKKMKNYMQERRVMNSKVYEIPRREKYASAIHSYTFQGMDYHVLDPLKNKNIPLEEDQESIILYFHGGAYVNQPVLQHWVFLDEIAQKSATSIVVPIYPKAPNACCSEAMETLLVFYEQDFLKRAKGKRIVFMGDSAGGGLAITFYKVVQERELRLPKLLQLFSPWVDVTMTDPQIPGLIKQDPMLSVEGLKIMGSAWAKERELDDPFVSPIYGDLELPCRVRIFVGTREILLPDSR